MKTLPIFASLCLLATASHAQERTAGGALETQMSWSSLKSLVDAANTNSKAAHVRIDQLEACGKSGLLYAPGQTGADTNGCMALPALKTTIASAKQQHVGAASATCPAGSVVISGGGSCGGGYIHTFSSKPLNTTTWHVTCDTIGSTMAEAYAVCAKF